MVTVKRAVGVVFSVLVGALGTGCATTQSTRLPNTVVLPLKQQRLPNGITVVTHGDESSSVASITLVVGVGAKDDPPGREGLAHAVEHLAFRAERGAEPSLRLRLHRMGAAFNAYTSSEATVYVATAPSASLRALVRAFTDIATNPLEGVTPATLDIERGVLDNERRFRNENGAPGEVVDRLRALVYGRTPLGKPIGGTAQSLRAITLEDAKAFAASHYRPGSMTVAVSGPLGDLGALLEPLASIAPPSGSTAGRPSGAPSAANLDEAGIEHVASSVSTPELWLGWSLPAAYGANAAALEIMSDMASGALAAGAWDRHADVTAAHCFLDRGRTASMLACRAFLSSTASLASVKRSLVNVVRRGIADRALSPDSRYVLTRSMATQKLLGLEPLGWRTEQFAEGWHFAKDARFSLELAQAIAAAESGALMDLYDRLLTEASARGVLAVPSNAPVLEAAPLTVPELALRGADIPEAERLLDGLRPLRVVERMLENRLRVLVVSRADARFQTALLGFFDGAARVPPAVVEAARWAYRSYLVEPPRGVLQSFRWDLDATRRIVRGPAGDAGVLLSRLDEGLANFDFAWKNEVYLDFRDDQRRRENDPRERAPRDFRMQLFFGHTYGTPIVSADIDAITVNELRAWYDAVHRPENAVLVLVGPEAPERLFQLAADRLGGWQRRAEREAPVEMLKPLAITSRSGPRLVVGNRPSETQVTLEVGCVLPVTSAASAAAEDVLVRLLDDALDSDLRQRTGATYGIRVSLERLRGGTTVLHVGTAVANEQLGRSLKTLREWFAEDVNLLSEDSVKLGRFAALRDYILDNETSADIASNLFDYARRGLSANDLGEQAQRIARVELSAVQDLIAACRATSLFSAVGDESRIRGAWAAP
jgi:zinc protease